MSGYEQLALWLQVRVRQTFSSLRHILITLTKNTLCEEARCRPSPPPQLHHTQYSSGSGGSPAKGADLLPPPGSDLPCLTYLEIEIT